MTTRPLRADPAKDPTLNFERRQFQSTDVQLVIGIDEVGRGAIAGPVAIGAHVVTPDCGGFPVGLRDSKLISAKRREALVSPLEEWGMGAVGYATAQEIDAQGITRMLGEAARRALLQLHEAGVAVDQALILVDGSHDWLSPMLKRPLKVITRVGGDRECASVAAASVRAKVARDALMSEAHGETPHYAWNTNKGYGASAHYAGIAEYGLTPMHRHTWVKRSPLHQGSLLE